MLKMPFNAGLLSPGTAGAGPQHHGVLGLRRAGAPVLHLGAGQRGAQALQPGRDFVSVQQTVMRMAAIVRDGLTLPRPRCEAAAAVIPTNQETR
jgi:hypothetical protein